MLKHRDNPRLGRLITPHGGTQIDDDLPWAADNGCFGGLDADAFRRMLNRLPAGALFITVPDVVGDHRATVAYWYEWSSEVARFGPPAFVLQDGCTMIPAGAAAVFIGGTTDYKCGPKVVERCREAKQRGLWLHMGRVNTKRRVRYAAELGCDSIDGTTASRWPDRRLPELLNWTADADALAAKQGRLF